MPCGGAQCWDLVKPGGVDVSNEDRAFGCDLPISDPNVERAFATYIAAGLPRVSSDAAEVTPSLLFGTGR